MSTLAIVPDDFPDTNGVPVDQDNSNISRSDFPEDFIFGTGTSAFQVEGAADVGGKGSSIWDDLCLRNPSIIADGANGNVACDMYYRYKEDIAHMKKMGFDSYRFSIAWPRILPGGRTAAGVNREGIVYYNELIDTVIAAGMKPFVTLFHFDLPDCLQKEYDGFLSRQVITDFVEFVDICFWEFGDRVKFWTTFNEPWTYNVNGYIHGIFPPRKSTTTAPTTTTSKKSIPAHRAPAHVIANAKRTAAKASSDVKYDTSDPSKNVYLAARNMLLAHAAAVHTYRTKYQIYQGGKIGIVLNSHWHVPNDKHSEADKAACQRALDFMMGWYLEPVLYGKYPQSMIDNVPPENLAHFSAQESQLLKGSIDFLGLNYYTTNYVTNNSNPDGQGYDADQKLTTSYYSSPDNVPIGPPCGSDWLFIVPWGLYDHLAKLKDHYPGLPEIYITENGMSDKDDPKITAKDAKADQTRVKFYQDHLANLLKARNDGVNVKGYFLWAYCDNFEWAEGYEARFGIVFVDYRNKLTRYPKNSAIWFAKFLQGKKALTDNTKKRAGDGAVAIVNGQEDKRLKVV